MTSGLTHLAVCGANMDGIVPWSLQDTDAGFLPDAFR